MNCKYCGTGLPSKGGMCPGCHRMIPLDQQKMMKEMLDPRLNEYRNKDYPADIITFAIFADDDSKFILDADINLGEIIIALDKVKEEAKNKNIEDEYELYFLISHGILHLLGFDHQTEEDYNFVIGIQNKALEYALGEVS